MKKRILIGSLGISIAMFFIAATYYVAFYLPKKQSAGIELAKLEMENQIAQEKTKQLTMEKEAADMEAAKQQLADQKQQQADADAAQQAVAKSQQQKVASAAISKCLANANAIYNEKASKVKYPSDNADSTIAFFNANRIQARNECYK